MQAQVKSSRRRRWRRDAGCAPPRNPSLSTSPAPNAVRKHRRGEIDGDREIERNREREREGGGMAGGRKDAGAGMVDFGERENLQRGPPPPPPPPLGETRLLVARRGAPVTPWCSLLPSYHRVSSTTNNVATAAVAAATPSTPPPPPPSPTMPRDVDDKNRRVVAAQQISLGSGSSSSLGCFAVRFDRPDSGDWHRPSPRPRKVAMSKLGSSIRNLSPLRKINIPLRVLH